jgi:hypothetical protein
MGRLNILARLILALLMTFSLIIGIAGTVLADWEEGDPHKMHFPQLPDTGDNAWAADAGGTGNYTDPLQVADDFECYETGWITEIHFWGLWMNDFRDSGDADNPIFHVGIWTNDPDDDGTGPDFSKPDELKWQDTFGPDDYIENIYYTGGEGIWYLWYEQDSPPPNVFSNQKIIYQYNLSIDPSDAFLQEEDEIYWLSISESVNQNMFAWHTSLEHWEDVAVWNSYGDTDGWTELRDPPPYEDVTFDMAFVINGQPAADLGDADDSLGYPVTYAYSGAYHLADDMLFLGSEKDYEPDGQPSFDATGDDTSGDPDDEDGVVFTSPLVPGQQATIGIEYVVPADVEGAYIDAWVDFDRSGSWDADEQIVNATVNESTTEPDEYTFNVPAPPDSVCGPTFARFRLSLEETLGPTGLAESGEVEDYRVFISCDYGDAPDNENSPLYPTLFDNNGAGHIVIDNFFLGSSIDNEADGQPNTDATGDDVSNNDEDGVTFTTPLVPNGPASVNVTSVISGGANGLLDAWIDFNIDGDWDDAGEQIIDNEELDGDNDFDFNVPAPPDSEFGKTFARFRLSSQGDLAPTGLAESGEVEDYEVEIVADFGDAPDPTYPTLLPDGARHIGDGMIHLGSNIDYEIDGQQSADATGDNSADLDDEDGVTFTSLLIKGRTATITVDASGTGNLNAWLDVNGDGNWDGAGEHVIVEQNLSGGTHDMTFYVPCSEDPPLPVSQTFMRFRFSTASGLSYDGLAHDGEVEDYMVDIYTTDYGDAPEPYPTADAYHIVDDLIYIGSSIDPECQARPNDDSTGDDIDNSDDEDGVNFTSSIVVCEEADIIVTASVAGYLDGWIDYNANGDWADPGERIFLYQELNAGENALSFPVPCNAKTGSTVARFRFESSNFNNHLVILEDVNAAQAEDYDGEAHNGEIEDYKIRIRAQYEQEEPSTVVGGNIFTVNKVGLLAPWVSLAVIILASGLLLYRRRVHSMK